MSDKKKKAAQLRSKFYLEVAHFFSEELEYSVTVFGPAHIRLTRKNHIVDIYSTGEKWHNLKKNKRGDIGPVDLFIPREFALREETAAEPVYTLNKGFQMDSVMPVGKHKGTLLKNVPKNYFKWIYDNYNQKSAMWKFVKDNYDWVHD